LECGGNRRFGIFSFANGREKNYAGKLDWTGAFSQRFTQHGQEYTMSETLAFCPPPVEFAILEKNARAAVPAALQIEIAPDASASDGQTL
jgi:hypothetical protein